AEAGAAADVARDRQGAVQDQMLFAVQQSAGRQAQPGVAAPSRIFAENRGERRRNPQVLFIDMAQQVRVQRVAAEARAEGIEDAVLGTITLPPRRKGIVHYVWIADRHASSILRLPQAWKQGAVISPA